MLEPRFCYRILPQAKMATDELGNDCEAFTQVNFEGGKRIDKEQYDKVHLSFKNTIADQIGINADFLECISQEEYDEHNEED